MDLKGCFVLERTADWVQSGKWWNAADWEERPYPRAGELAGYEASKYSPVGYQMPPPPFFFIRIPTDCQSQWTL